MQRHWDIFCRVIDNYGDIGVCWRLARQLAAEHSLAVRLWVDDLASLRPLCPTIDSGLTRQRASDVEVLHWRENTDFEHVADVVIEAFACELPAAYVAAMATVEPKPRWINLEYLSAESWVDGCHGMASPHPTLPLVKHFFFPGFSPATGGLLSESGLLAARNAVMAEQAAHDSLEISLFCYDTAPVGELLDHLAQTPFPVRCHVAPGKPLAVVRAHLGGAGPWQLGHLRVEPFPFLSMDDYDRLLWRCDINFVRGEDSFLRAQWAGKPFVWQIYEQEDGAHLDKLNAFVDRYTSGLDAISDTTVRAIFNAWNTGVGLGPAWADFLVRHGELSTHAESWQKQLAAAPDLAFSLVKFCQANV